LNYISFFATVTEGAILNATMGLAWGTGAILGPVIGGAFSDSSATWRWVSYLYIYKIGMKLLT
jgi:MFS family permease